MKKDIGNNKIKHLILLIVVLALVLLFIFIYQSKTEYKDEKIAISCFMKYHDDPNNLIINILEKYNVSEKEIYYYVEWMYPQENDNEEYNLLLIYNPNTQSIKLAFFADMEQGLSANVKSKWDEIKHSPDVIFTKDEIHKIKQAAIEIRNSYKNHN